jgi:hypothetical protein
VPCPSLTLLFAQGSFLLLVGVAISLCTGRIRGTQALIDALTPVPEAFVDLPDSPGDPDADETYVALYGAR